MSDQENIELVRGGFAAFATGDMAALNSLFAEDAVWHAAGNGAMSGPRDGRDAILAYFGDLMAGTGGDFKVTLVDLAGSGERVYAMQHTHAEREGRSIDPDAVNVFHVSGGVVTEVREFFQDSAETDAFWA